jgi:uncharacterized protein YyaL (SSP411 family)
VPLYGGTYFPPKIAQHAGLSASPAQRSPAYRDQPEEVTRTAVSLLEELRRMSIGNEANDPLTLDLLDAAHRSIAETMILRTVVSAALPSFRRQ